MNILPADKINAKAVFSDLPALIKGYLRVGAVIGDGAVIDPQFNTTDVCIVAKTHHVTARYRKHYERKIDKEIPSQTIKEDSDQDNLTMAKGTA
jgi:putative hemolysin